MRYREYTQQEADALRVTTRVDGPNRFVIHLHTLKGKWPIGVLSTPKKARDAVTLALIAIVYTSDGPLDPQAFEEVVTALYSCDLDSFPELREIHESCSDWIQYTSRVLRKNDHPSDVDVEADDVAAGGR